MCLLVEQYSNTDFSKEFLTSVYQRNSDGIGVMWVEDQKLHYHKTLCKNLDEFLTFYNTHIKGKDCCWHARMKTHGDIDMTNCHPYPVLGFEDEHDMPMLLMHNGVLFTGNDKDRSKSDTWHYIRDYIQPILRKNPGFLHTKEFKDLIERHIGSGNKFALMDASGKPAVIFNKHAGTYYQGAWLSNTYAWDHYNLTNQKKQTALSYHHYSGYKPTEHLSPWKKPETSTSVVQEMMDCLCNAYPDLYEKISFAQMTIAMRVAGLKEVEELVILLDDGYILEDEFLTAIQKPSTIQKVLLNIQSIDWHEQDEKEDTTLFQYNLGI